MSDLPRAPDLPAHDPTGPSSLGRILGCPGSLRASHGKPALRSQWAEEGERLHKAIEARLRHEPHAELAPSDEALINACLEFVSEKIAGRVVIRQWIEERVSLLDGVELVNYGTLDLGVLTDSEFLLFDFKFGRKVHQHALVLQLANYGGAAATSIPDLQGTCGPPVSAYAYFPVYDESYVWRAPDLCAAVPTIVQKVKQIIAVAFSPDPPLRPGPWCDYCDALPECAAVRAQTALVAEHFQAKLPADPRKIVDLYDAAKLAEKQSAAVLGRIREILDEDPRALPGLEYQEVNGVRSVNDPLSFWQSLVGAGHVDAGAFSDRCTQEVISISKAEELYVETHYKGRGNGNPTKDALKAQFRDITKAAVSQPTQKRLRRVSTE